MDRHAVSAEFMQLVARHAPLELNLLLGRPPAPDTPSAHDEPQQQQRASGSSHGGGHHHSRRTTTGSAGGPPASADGVQQAPPRLRGSRTPQLVDRSSAGGAPAQPLAPPPATSTAKRAHVSPDPKVRTIITPPGCLMRRALRASSARRPHTACTQLLPNPVTHERAKAQQRAHASLSVAGRSRQQVRPPRKKLCPPARGVRPLRAGNARSSPRAPQASQIGRAQAEAEQQRVQRLQAAVQTANQAAREDARALVPLPVRPLFLLSHPSSDRTWGPWSTQKACNAPCRAPTRCTQDPPTSPATKTPRKASSPAPTAAARASGGGENGEGDTATSNAARRGSHADYAKPWRSHMTRPGQPPAVLTPAPLAQPQQPGDAPPALALPPPLVVMQEGPLVLPGPAAGGAAAAAAAAGPGARASQVDTEAHARLQVRAVVVFSARARRSGRVRWC